MRTTTISAPAGNTPIPRASTAGATATDTPAAVDRSNCPAAQHGTRWARMQHRCTCPDTQLAVARYNKRLRAGIQPPALIPAVGTSRRLQALAAIGWSSVALAERLGCTHQAVSKLRAARLVHRDTAARIAALYRELADTPAPDSLSARQTRNAAARHQWARPDQWADADIDDPAALSDLDGARTGDAPPAGEDILWLASPAGGSLTHEQIAERLGLELDQVQDLARAAASANRRAKLTDQDVHDIRARWVRDRAAGCLDRHAIAAAYGVTVPTVLGFVTGRSRPNLQLPDLLGDSPFRVPRPHKNPRKTSTTSTTSPIPTTPAADRLDADGSTARRSA